MKKSVILCVDDEQIVLNALREQLKQKFANQYIYEFAESAEEALETIEDLAEDGHQVAMIITDQIMPGMTGDQFLVDLHRNHPRPIKVLLTGQAGLDSAINAINNADLFRYIVKPWEEEDFLLTVEKGLQQYYLLGDLENKVEERTLELSKALDDLRSTQEQLVESKKMAALGNLVAGIAHEINTPVGIGVTVASRMANMAKDLLEIYQSGGMKRGDLEDYLQSTIEGSQLLLRNLERAADLVQSFKQIAVDQSSDQERQFQIYEYLHKIIKSLQPRLKSNSHQVIIKCDENLSIMGCPGIFSQIITNLVINSLIHGFAEVEQGEIRIEVCREKDRITLEYKDNGKGIDDNIKDKIFEPFFTTNRQGGGSGLGLHIVYNLVSHKLKGNIHCESTAGEGTRFFLDIPYKS